MNSIKKSAFAFCLILICLPCCQTFGQHEKKPLKVFLLVGQSNMQGHARLHTLEHLGMDSKTEPIFKTLANDDATAKIFEDVWINSLTSGSIKKGNLTAGYGADENKIGPEFAFGAYMQKLVDEPILIIKTAWGGKSLHTDFRSPNAGEYEFSSQQIENFEKQEKDVEEIKTQKKAATGAYYRLMLEHIKAVLGDINSTYPGYDKQRGYELAGFVWFQGWNDMVDGGVYPNRDQDGGYDNYGKLLAHFIRDVRKDLSAPKMPFVIGVMGVGGPTDKYGKEKQRYSKVHQNFRDAMIAPTKLPEFENNVAAVLTEKYWDMELSELRARQAKIGNEVRTAKKKEQLEREAEKRLRDKLMAEEFSKQELLVMEKGISNQEYHYLGSAKILAQVGKGFAEALHKLQKK